MSGPHPTLSQRETAPGPDPADLSQCVHCGLCLPNCPTYLVTGYEAESPRGRIHLIQSLNEGRIEPNEADRQHLELCLVCRNCESVCPSGVPFGRIMEAGRAQLYRETQLAWHERALRRLAFTELLPHQGRLRVLFGLLLIYQRSGLRRLARALLPQQLQDLEALLPKLPRPFNPRFEVFSPRGKVKHRVGLFTGCVMPLVYGPVHEATLRVLLHNGCEVHVPKQQVCCGALNVHGGERAVSAELARQKNGDAAGELPPGARAAYPRSAAQVAGHVAGPHAQRHGAARAVLRQCRPVYADSAGHGEPTARRQDARCCEYRRHDRSHCQPRVHDAIAARTSTGRHTRRGEAHRRAAGRGVRGVTRPHFDNFRLSAYATPAKPSNNALP